MPDLRDEFEALMRQKGWGDMASLKNPDGSYVWAQSEWEVYQAATERAAKKEREECAKLCDEQSDFYMEQARGGDQSGASDHKACAAVECADAIRSTL